MDTFLNFLKSASNGLHSIYAEISSWLSYENFEKIFSVLSHWLFQGSYYVGIGTGLIISGAILFPLLNKLLTHLTYRYETTTFATVIDPPELTKDQIKLLKDTLYWWNLQCDRWYITEPACVDKALIGQEINLIDVHRLRDSTRVGDLCGKKASPETQNIFDDLEKALARTEAELAEKVRFKKIREKLVDDMDVVTKQLSIAKYSAIAAMASAAAAAFTAYITYLNTAAH